MVMKASNTMATPRPLKRVGILAGEGATSGVESRAGFSGDGG